MLETNQRVVQIAFCIELHLAIFNIAKQESNFRLN